MWIRLALSCIVLLSMACATVNNTVDRSRTVKRSLPYGAKLTGVAIPMIPENAVSEGLSQDLSEAIPAAVRRAYPGARVIEPPEFGQRLMAQKGYLNHFAAWRTAYEQTGVIDPRPLKFYAKALGGASHLLLVRSTHLDREKVTMQEAMKTAPCRRLFCSGYRDSIYQTDLKVIAELIDVETGAVAWRGVGQATRIQQGQHEIDFGLFIREADKGDSVETLGSQMVSMAADGIVNQIEK